MRVSVIIPLYNSSPYIAETLKSVFSQTHQDFEIIAVDDGSSDGTPELVRSLYKDTRLCVIEQDHLGVSAARNRGMDEARGEYFAFLDHDDIWMKDKLQLQIAALSSKKTAVLTCGDFEIIDDVGNSRYNIGEMARNNWRYTEDLFESLLINGENFIGLSSVIIRKVDLKQFAFRDFNVAEEYDLWLRLGNQYPDYVFVPQIVYQYRLHESNASSVYNEELYSDSCQILEEWVAREMTGSHARALRDNLARASLRYGHWLLAQNRRDEAVKMMKRAIALNRINLRNWWGYVKCFL